MSGISWNRTNSIKSAHISTLYISIQPANYLVNNLVSVLIMNNSSSNGSHVKYTNNYPPHTTKLLGVYWFHSVRPSVCPSVRPASRVRSVASIVQDGFFPHLVQMITSMRGCVACDDPWPWPISSRSFGLDLENRVRSVASTVLDGFSLYLAQMITIIRGCVACYVFFRIWKFEFLANFWNFSALTLKKKSTVLDGFFPYLAHMITSMRGCVAYNDLWPWPISSRSLDLDFENRVHSVTFSVLYRLFPYLPQIITTIRGCVMW